MAPRHLPSRIVASALALTLLLGTVPAFAADGPAVVPAGVTVAGTSLAGMTADEARIAIAAACTTPTLAPLPVLAGSVATTLTVAGAVALDVDGMAASALAATEATDLVPVWAADSRAISGFVTQLATLVNSKPKNAYRKIVRHRLRIGAEVAGASLDTTAAATALTGAVTVEIASGGSAQETVTVPVTALVAKVTRANIGKTIVIVLHERRLYLYKNTKIQRKYRCAIGMRAYPTPKGLFKVIKKNPHPGWTNPYSAWSKTMPRYIKPGYYNPLGLRALYINSPGIRIHGTAKTSSMGQAASHGCIRLTNKNIVKLYPLVPVGTPVYILS